MIKVLMTWLYTMSTIVSLILLGLIIYNKIQDIYVQRQEAKHRKKVDEQFKDFKKSGGKLTTLSSLRKCGEVRLDVSKHDNIFFVNESSNDAMGMFLSVSPGIVDALSKVANKLATINDMIDHEDEKVSEEEIRLRLLTINSMLQPLIEVSETLNNQIYQICEIDVNSFQEVEMNNDLVYGFINMSKSMVNFAMGYLHMSNVVQQKIIRKKLSFKKEFADLNSSFLRIFFSGVMNCISMVDSTVSILK